MNDNVLVFSLVFVLVLCSMLGAFIICYRMCTSPQYNFEDDDDAGSIGLAQLESMEQEELEFDAQQLEHLQLLDAEDLDEGDDAKLEAMLEFDEMDLERMS